MNVLITQNNTSTLYINQTYGNTMTYPIYYLLISFDRSERNYFHVNPWDPTAW